MHSRFNSSGSDSWAGSDAKSEIYPPFPRTKCTCIRTSKSFIITTFRHGFLTYEGLINTDESHDNIGLYLMQQLVLLE